MTLLVCKVHFAENYLPSRHEGSLLADGVRLLFVQQHFEGDIGVEDGPKVHAIHQNHSLSCRSAAQCNHWHSSDDSILRALFVEAGLRSDLVNQLTDTLRTLSEIRRGGLVLVPDDDNALPTTIGQIDTSALGTLLNQQLELSSFTDTFRSNASVQVLSSDGITVVAKTGRLLACGRIIDLAGVSGGTGGGRSQAAKAASSFGLAIKVSADGPITAFRHGKKLFTI